METKKGVKLDEAKIRLDLIPVSLVIGVGEVLTFGAKKYTPDGWQLVPDAKQRYEAALMRHLMSYKSGEKLDSESGLSHLKHLLTNAAFLLWFEEEENKKVKKVTK